MKVQEIRPLDGFICVILIKGTFLPGGRSGRATGDTLMDLQKLTLEEIVARLRHLAEQIREQARPASPDR